MFQRWLKRLRALPQRPNTSPPVLHDVPTIPARTPRPDAYTRSSWVYVAVNRIAEAAALVPLSVYRMDGENRVPIANHPLERLLQQPNPTLSGFDLIEQTVGALELTGNAYWFLAGDGDGVPLEIWPLRPDRVAIVPDGKHGVNGYVYTVDGVQMPLKPLEVVHFRRWHPLSDHYGLSPLAAGGLAVETDTAMAAWNRNTFHHDHAVPAGIVTLPENTPQVDFERVQQEWRATYGGIQRRTAFIRAGSATWQSITPTHADLQFLNGREANRDEILSVFGVPIGLVSDNATEANAKVAERTFIERTLYPKLVRLAAKISSDLAPFYGDNLRVAFDDIRPTDHSARVDDIRAAYPVLSINEIRARYYDLPPVAWGDAPASGHEPNGTVETVE